MKKVFTKAKIRAALMDPEQIENLFGEWSEKFSFTLDLITPLNQVNQIYYHLSSYAVVRNSRLLGRSVSHFSNLDGALAYCRAYCDERGYEYSPKDREFGEPSYNLTIVRL